MKKIFWGYNSKEEALKYWPAIIIAVAESNNSEVNIGGEIHIIKW